MVESSEFLQVIINNIPHGIISIDVHGKITFVNQQALDHFNKQKHIPYFIGEDLLDFFPSLSLENWDAIQKNINNQDSFDIKDLGFLGKQFNIQGRNIKEGMIISIFDVTQSFQSRNQDVLMLLRGEELNRRKLYKELHDGIGPLVSTVNLKLDVVKTELNEVQHKTIEEVNSIQELMQAATNDLRSISQTLIPSALIDFGIVAALNDLCKSISSTYPIEAHFYESGIKELLDINLALGIFRIVQEIVDNTLNHANAKKIHIQLTQHEDYLSLIVEDDGVGFDKNNMKEILKKGVGIHNIKTRTKSFKGTFHIDSDIGKGVNISIEFPINKKYD